MLSRPTYSRRSHDHRRRPRRPRCRHGRLRGRGSRRGNRVVVVTVAAIV